MSRAERRDRTREELIAAADRLFTANGFHATSVDDVAAEAGYTKGAVYSNFDAKEDLFFAVYERRAQRTSAEIQRLLDETGPAAALERVALDSHSRRGRDDGWLAVFFEFWAHAVRHPRLRDRFAAIHGRAQQPLLDAVERLANERGLEPPGGAAGLTVAMSAMQLGLILERLTRPDAVDVELGAAMARFVLGGMQREAVT